MITRFAQAHPEILRPVFRSPVNGAAIYAIEAVVYSARAP